ncbi:hypothetical protein CAOG_06562 [Capsaspora owczarzaki ATCC 30864]|uniref:Peptidase S54 rhomboid domain-containing protein n=1 Tax=Capsaspora owczarzaki (strain ATCC 30864) TaxID=595528 RepID=A0A0D2WUA6_CAPO3|nr:hypothetical protein CAOG_06562 [Capsaspora owczarzaki ATCC 30864]KJE96205.1 hypothetical protein CAOG_006562 [Capsaspora owczarzaki ATCC 30864]|eukprot:XP_004345311.1 hypothetical protein CAOG_06562 [Capsaspora owczarzaki ATCC 30864]
MAGRPLRAVVLGLSTWTASVSTSRAPAATKACQHSLLLLPSIATSRSGGRSSAGFPVRSLLAPIFRGFSSGSGAPSTALSRAPLHSNDSQEYIPTGRFAPDGRPIYMRRVQLQMASPSSQDSQRHHTHDHRHHQRQADHDYDDADQQERFRRAYEDQARSQREPNRFVKPILFTAVVAVGSFAIAAVVEHDRIVRRYNEPPLSRFQQWLNKAAFDLPSDQPAPVLESLRNYIDAAPPSVKLMWGIVGLNTLVFAAWRIPALLPFMYNNFLSHPGSGRALPKLLSAFSHRDPVHFGINMFALYGFGQVSQQDLGSEQFVALFLTAAVGSSLASHLYANAARRFVPSLGASGALLGIVASAVAVHPNLAVGIPFVPDVYFPAWQAFAATCTLDVLGLIFRWRMFDHAAHLGGALIGGCYALYCRPTVWGEWKRAWLQQYLSTKAHVKRSLGLK